MSRSMTIRSEGGRIDILDYLKGFSIFTIVIMHLMQTHIDQLPGWLQKAASVGGGGVHVFFFCSGAGLYMGWLRKRMTVAQFFRRRFLKIYLPYILVAALSALLPWIDPELDRLKTLASHVFLYKMFSSELTVSFGPFWFISAIIQFYILFIPLCLLKEKLNNDRLFCGLALAVSVCWWVLVYLLGAFEKRAWSSFCLQYLWEFALGICVGGCLSSGRELKLPYWGIALGAVMGLGLQAVMSLTSDTLRIFNDIPALFGYMLLALLLYALQPVRRAGRAIAKFSYEWYLTHMLVFATVYHFAAPQTLKGQLLAAIPALALSLAAAYGYSFLTKKLR